MAETPHRFVIDSIEEGMAALEADGGLLHLPLALLPRGAREGDVLTVAREDADDGGCVLRLRIDAAATGEALRRSREQLAALPPQNDPGGDIVL